MTPPPPPAHLRQEIFALGSRHLGDALKGARRELQDDGLTRDRRKLLEAVVRHLEAGTPQPRAPQSNTPVSSEPALSTPTPGPSLRRPVGAPWTRVVYGAAFIMLVVWASSALLRLAG